MFSSIESLPMPSPHIVIHRVILHGRSSHPRLQIVIGTGLVVTAQCASVGAEGFMIVHVAASVASILPTQDATFLASTAQWMIPHPIALALVSAELSAHEVSCLQCLLLRDACSSFRHRHGVCNLLAAAGADAVPWMLCTEFTLCWACTQHARHSRLGYSATVVYKVQIEDRTVAPLFADCMIWLFWQQFIAYTHVICCSDLTSRWVVGSLWQRHVAQNHFTAITITSVSSIILAFDAAVSTSDFRTKTKASRLTACVPVL